MNSANVSYPTLSVGVLSADLLSLGAELDRLAKAGVAMVHVDVMDGCFVPMMTVGPPFVKALKTPLVKDVHLMIADPIDKLESYVAAGADIVTVHIESTPHIHRALQALGKMTNVNDPDRGIVRGAGLNPGTPIGTVEPLLDELEMVCLLGINPGWGGQKLTPSIGARVQTVRELARHARRDVLVCIDGGVTHDNFADVAQLGADIVVTGSAAFAGGALAENLQRMFTALGDPAL